MNRFTNMIEVTRKPSVHKVALWEGGSAGDAKAFCKRHGFPKFTIGTANRGAARGLIIPSRDPNGLTIDTVVPAGYYLAVIEDHLGIWLKPMSQAELDNKYDYDREAAE